MRILGEEALLTGYSVVAPPPAADVTPLLSVNRLILNLSLNGLVMQLFQT